MTDKQSVLARYKTCNCGCRGADPQHKPSYRRVIRDEVEVDERDGARRVGKRGTVRLPGRGLVGVHVVQYLHCGRWIGGQWEADELF